MPKNGLSAKEISVLEEGLPDLAEWSEELLVPVTLHRLKDVVIAWINPTWFAERGLDISVGHVRLRVIAWLIDSFGYAIREASDSSELYRNSTRIFHADRYGNTTGTSVHGGSGRACIVGKFQIKGIGVTPLAGVGANWGHSHGCASLEEGLREAVYSSIAYCEFPHGAIPVIAVLEIGLLFPSPPDGPAAPTTKRAIIVRPAVLRLAHAERAPLFLKAIRDFKNSQLQDVKRTKDVITRWMSDADGTVSSKLPNVSELFQRVARQIAFGRAQRLFNGGYFSSNLSVYGELLDFGGMRAVPDWSKAKNIDHAPGFGEEIDLVLGVIESLVFYFNKYGPPKSKLLSVEELIVDVCSWLDDNIKIEFLRIWGLQELANDPQVVKVADVMEDFFRYQQRSVRNYKHYRYESHSRLFGLLVGGDKLAENQSVEVKILQRIRSLLKSFFRSSPDGPSKIVLCWGTAARYLLPREYLFREEIQEKIVAVLGETRVVEAHTCTKVSNFIDLVIGRSRRHWNHLPVELIVRAHVCRGSSSALLCSTPIAETVLWLEGVRFGNSLKLFDEEIDISEFSNFSMNGKYWTALVGGVFSPTKQKFETTTGRMISLPSMDIHYPVVARTWLRD